MKTLPLSRRASVALMVLALSLGGCSEPNPCCSLRTGALVVTAPATGTAIPVSGGTVTVDDTAPRPLLLNGTVTYAALAVGTHVVAFNDLQASNCSRTDSNTVTVTVEPAATAHAAFPTKCFGTGSIKMTVTTTGVDLDSDGYGASITNDSLGGWNTFLAPNDSTTLTNAREGTYSVSLNGVAPNCTSTSSNPTTVTVVNGQITRLALAVNCVSVLPAGSVIAFTSLRDGNAEVYVLRAGASFTAVNLTNNAAADSAPAWSHDGLGIAFATARDLDDEIYQMSADGSVPVNLTLRAGSDQQAAWAPDGSKVAFVSTRNDRGDSVPAEIFVMAPDGSGTRTALTVNSGGSTRPAWSPNGTKIAFVTVRDGNAEIYVMNADGSAPVNLTNDAAADDHPVWSPDGTRIAFVSDRGGRTAAYVMRDDGSGVTPVAPSISDTATAAADDYGSWSPDGTRLALTAGGIVVANADGSGTIRLVTDAPRHCARTRVGIVCSSSSASTPAWSPDGTKLVYHRTTRSCRGSAPCAPANPQSTIWLVSPDGTSSVLLTSEAGVGAIRPVWKP